ncbi:hypothetical protein AB0M39_37195 [Streptomyces sp. NPDC051907]|uniref:hypothetical protein n=1 Tax=Streptomyces sp. NPDC051907 TaxID=3155284 RepID=UPI003431D479
MTAAPMESENQAWWGVTLPMTTPDGRSGSHTFVVQARTPEKAVKRSMKEALGKAARDHRRDASVDVHADSAVVTRWLPEGGLGG